MDTKIVSMGCIYLTFKLGLGSNPEKNVTTSFSLSFQLSILGKYNLEIF